MFKQLTVTGVVIRVEVEVEINIRESLFIHLFFNGGMSAGRVVP